MASERGPTPDLAPLLPLAQAHLYSVEYPGYVSQASLPRAVQTLDQRALDAAFRRNADVLELRLRPEDPFAHPLRGELCKTSTLLMRVVKRKRKDGRGGEYTAEVVGSIARTARFRAIADYQFAPDPQERVVQLRHALDTMDVDAIKAFRFHTDQQREAAAKEEVAARRRPLPADPTFAVDPALVASTSHIPDSGSTEADAQRERDEVLARTLGSIPPPLWHHAPIPLVYGYKPNPASVIQTYVDSTGAEKQRLVNKARWKGYGPASVAFADKDVPGKPPAIVEEARHLTNPELVSKVAKLFETRPVWTRLAIYNQVSSAEEREIQNSKLVMPLVAYIFSDGPWRDTFIRLGYDPRLPENKDESYLYQRLYFRNTIHEMRRSKLEVSGGSTRKGSSAGVAKDLKKPQAADGNAPKKRDTRSHIFDGQSLTSETAVFQLCDIEDPMLKGLIRDPDALSDTCNDRDGWYNETELARIKAVLRRKFFTMLESGRIVTDAECMDLLEAEVKPGATLPSQLVRTFRKGKHNMAKGAQAPEDAAVQRLRAAIRDMEAKGDEEENDEDVHMEGT